jgi:hypothetical protein
MNLFFETASRRVVSRNQPLGQKFQYFIQTSMVLAIPATAVKRVLQIKTFYLLLGK